MWVQQVILQDRKPLLSFYPFDLKHQLILNTVNYPGQDPLGVQGLPGWPEVPANEESRDGAAGRVLRESGMCF
jgi:hypothetical protein